MNFIEQRVKVFLEAYHACGRDLVKGKFDMVDGALMCLECKDLTKRADSVAIDCEQTHGKAS